MLDMEEDPTKILELHTNLIQIINNKEKIDINIRESLAEKLELLSNNTKEQLSTLGRTSFKQIVVLLTK